MEQLLEIQTTNMLCKKKKKKSNFPFFRSCCIYLMCVFDRVEFTGFHRNAKAQRGCSLQVGINKVVLLMLNKRHA